MLPCPGYYKQCCNEHWGTHVSFDSGFLSMYAQQWDCWIIRQFYFKCIILPLVLAVIHTQTCNLMLCNKVHLQYRRPWFNSWVRKIPWRRDRLPTPVFLGFLCGSADKESACNAEDLGSIPGLGRSPGEGRGYPLQYSGLENSMDCIVHGVAELDTTEQLSLSCCSMCLNLHSKG